ncbi:GlxA family transcriptional regulator [Arthrobacter sp. TMN-37]
MLTSVALIVLPGLTPFEFGVICEVFGVDRSTLGVGLPAFDFRICTPVPGTVETETGFSIVVDRDLSATEDADLVVVIPSHAEDPLPVAVAEALRAADRRGARLFSVCSGAFALAEAGLLDGKRATTHWAHARRFAEQYPRVAVDENVLYVGDGNILTSAGTAAGIDASLHLIRQEFGVRAAAAVARGMVVPPHRDGGQAQYIERPIPASGGDPIEELLVWLSANLEEELSVPVLARRVHMSERTFARRFRAVTGATPAAWITAQRVQRAQLLLEETHLGIDSIARRSGFGQAVLLRQHFHRVLGVSPAVYRRTFHGPPEACCALAASDAAEQPA